MKGFCRFRWLQAVLLLGVLSGCEAAENSTVVSEMPLMPELVERPLYAGYAEQALALPVGLSIGGYGARLSIKTPYNEHLGGMQGRYQDLMVRAVVLRANSDVVFAKVPLVFVTDRLRVQVLRQLAGSYGLQLDQVLVITATHTHSGPARFWDIPQGLGIAGMDEYDPDVLAHLARQIAATVAQAYRDLAPARFGSTTLDRFDSHNQINRDRRSVNNNVYTNIDDINVYREGGKFKTKDHRLWLARIERDKREPIALVRMGMHGTVLSHALYSEDAPGGVEQAVARAIGGHAVYLQGAAGDASPAGGDGRDGLQQIEAVGQSVAAVIEQAWTDIELKDRLAIRAATQRKRVDRDELYAPDEFGEERGGVFYPYRYGGFFCGQIAKVVDEDDGVLETRMHDGNLGCIDPEALEGILGTERDLPITELRNAVWTAVQLGDTRIITLPGEPVAGMASAIYKQYPDAIVLGYSQAHLLYLTPKDDWFQGGYEAAMNIWGWQLGDWLVKNGLELLDTVGIDSARFPQSLEAPYPEPEQGRLGESIAAVRLRLIADVPASVNRFATLGFAFVGSDDPTQSFAIQRLAGDKLVGSSQDPGYRIRMTRRPEGDILHEVLWEPGIDVEAGTYRFAVSAVVEGELQQITTSDFVVVETSALMVTTTTHSGSVWHYPQWTSHPTHNEIMLDGLLDRWQTAGLRLKSLDSAQDYAVAITTGIVVDERGDDYAVAATCACFAAPTTVEVVDWRGE